MAAVYDAVDTRISRRVAIKEMSDSSITNPADRQQALAQFEQEAWMLAQLEHPNLPKVTDVFSSGGKQYLVMDYVDGNTLEKILQSAHGTLPEEQVIAWAAQLCDVLSYLHSRTPAIIFRDLKPSNIMINRNGQVKLIDFGIARLFKPGQAHDTMALGTLGYSAPEQHGSAQSDARTDIYALGVTLHELLTGHDPTHTPYNLPPVRRLNPSVTSVMEAVIVRATEHDPQKRWQSTSEIKLHITGALPPRLIPGGKSALPPPLPGGPIPRPRSARPTTRLLLAVAQLSNWQIVLALGGLLVLVALALWFGTPVLIQYPVIWNNIPSLVIVAPLVYAAMRRPWVASIAHVLVAMAGRLVIGLRMSTNDPSLWRVGPALAASILTGLMIEGAVRLLPHVRGKNREEAWQRELAWLAATALVVGILFMGVFWNIQFALNPVMLVAAVILGALGWFLGDLVQQYLFLRQTGLKRGPGGS
jgi:serine/threonine-protein kinase